ncbi:alpha-keto acid decarboxylase family protein [Hyphomicrobium sp.]|jgi:indolepyruvate decarboxylase|uniref:alpha-keto acid decarboxylase family protein n=1 Tax=Hyphomicrobium sp. TaxID=82 RepID=UPI002B6F6E90|nr:thiamine pyrophosphate-binding protein [Hyphomicrobium sp.]HVZ06035.1 thiamine pyrophosphate-binding protein [Hyphomicrobium sp.]
MPQSTVASFLTQRLKQIGLRHAFGVPGDYVLTFMDRLIASGIEFVGTCNELNAGYAADAYARINGVGCVCVTWGVGGFSAMNAVAGAYAEQVPVVVLVGSPRTMQRRSSMLLHHGVGDFTTMQQAYSHITVASVLLDDAAEAPQRIDQALARCMAEKRPIMIEIPVDMVDRSCQTPGPFAPPSRPPSDPEALHEALDEVMGLLSSASRAVILGGAELHRYGLMQDFYRLVEASALPVATTLLGKTVISENHPQAIGVYEGGTSRKEIRDIVENSDVLLCLGAWVSDINFGLQTSGLEGRHMILANSGRLKISQHVYEQVWIGDVVKGLADLMPKGGLRHPPFTSVSKLLDTGFTVEPGRALTVGHLAKRINAFVGDDTTVIAETGDSLFLAADLVMHHDVGFIGQAFYLSIGYALPATLGAALADPARRPVTFIGDGAFQMTVQELSTLCRHKSNAIILLLNNDGYTTERIIHEGPYNDIQPWAYHRLPEVFGGGWGRRVRTEDELEDALTYAQASNEGPAVIEIMLDRFDTSNALKRLGAALSPDRHQDSKGLRKAT